jgi:signal transduction histidine kinase
MMKQGTPYDLEKRYIRKDGSVIWVNVSASPVRDPKGKAIAAVAVTVDVTQRKKAEAALKQSRLHLEELVKRRTRALRAANLELESEIRRRKGLEGEILSISDREQERLGEELHDGLCQQLAAIGLMARATALRLKDHRVVNSEDLENITQLINDATISARNIARGLHRDEVDAAGFNRALRDLTERKVWTTPSRLELKTTVQMNDDHVASQLYRILREAVVNANKHARASEIVLEVARSNGDLVFSVTDNGTGFSRRTRRGVGLGFHIMKHRAESIGARLEFESPRGGGARIVCRLPETR